MEGVTQVALLHPWEGGPGRVQGQRRLQEPHAHLPSWPGRGEALQWWALVSRTCVLAKQPQGARKQRQGDGEAMWRCRLKRG